jgi:hypothetical protein
VALATTKTAADELSPDAGMAVPRAYHTDGFWIWPAAVGYYLHRYQLPPQPDLVAHIRARGFEVGAVPEPLRQAAAAQMLEELAAARRRQVEATAQQAPRRPEPETPEPEAVQPETPGPEPAEAEPEAPEPEAPRPGTPEAAAASLWLPEPVPAARAAESVPAAAPAELAAPPAWSFSRALIEAGNRHAAWVFEQIETFLAFMPVDEWTVDHDSRQYQQAGRRFAVDALGRLAEDGQWTWAWAEPEAWSSDPRMTERVRALREEGRELGIGELTAPVLDLSANADAQDPETAAEMLAWTVMGLAGARAYLGHSQGGQSRIYYLAFDEAIPAATPDLGAVVRYLTQGVMKFEENAADCVLGYIEHHGWEWSRSADGFEVSAAGLGSFTADLSEDGALTGISLH